MDLALWIATGVLGVVFVVSGVAKSTMSRERLLATGQTGIAPFPMPVVRMTAILELFGVAGLVLPWVLDTYRVLTPAAAIGLGVVMYGAAVSHASLREPRTVAANLAILVVCAFVAAGRLAAL